MTKTVFALVTAGVLGAAMLSTGAQAVVPDQAKGTTMRGNQTTLMQQQIKLNRDREMLRRDIRLGRTADARRLRREISADERAISRAKRGGMEQAPAARNMQLMPPAAGQQQNTSNTSSTPTTTPRQTQ